jgi:tetratricopeptide (TPR) repeat protein/2-polyprenyl-3-methyl-5-hydroxy-6-metoxy-1,4-benzoquinol methylase
MNRAEKRRQRKLAEKAAKKTGSSQVISLSPGQQTMTVQQAIGLGVQHHNAGRLPEAESIYQRILQADPNQHVVIQLLGVIAHQLGKDDVAVELITRALALKPDYAEAHNNLGITFKQLGRLEEARKSYRKAVEIKPDYAQAHNNLGAVLMDMGKLDKAAASYHQALVLKPDYVEAHLNLGNLLKKSGKLEQAVTSYRQAISLQPDHAHAHNILGNTLILMNKQAEAFQCHQRAVVLGPDNDQFWIGFAEALKTVSFTGVDENLWPVLLQLLQRPTARPADIVQPIFSAIRHYPNFPQIVELTLSDKLAEKIVYAKIAQQLEVMPLLLRILPLCAIHDLEIERMLTALRSAMLKAAAAGNRDDKGLAFSIALALQCFANEYVFSETDEEKTLLDQLEQQISVLVENQQEVPAILIAALGAYRPLYGFAWAQELGEREWTGDIKHLIKWQITEPLEERELRSEIPQATPIRNMISQSVREQYEENPYPRWIKTYIHSKIRPIGAVLSGAPHHLDLGDYVSPEQPQILIAGCGTGQQILNAISQFSNTRVLAFDLSLSSLSYACRKIRELGLTNIEFAQADIMELGSIGRQFDLIGCTGVLHHLADPVTGWQVLVDLLRPGGLMKIALYSETARRDIVSGRSFIAEQGYSTSPEDIRRCRQHMIALATAGDQEMAGICKKRDFFSLSECRDLLFHVQEHRFSLPQIEETLKALNLKFLGFELRNRNNAGKNRETKSDSPPPTTLHQWHQFELNNPDTFWGMYQFWCRKM